MSPDPALLLLLLPLLPTLALAEPGAPFTPAPGGTATLPLGELLALQRAGSAASDPKPAPPPVRSAVGRFEIAGRLLDAGLEASAQIGVNVLGDGWVAVPLFDLRRGTRLGPLPGVEGGTLAVIDRRLCLVTDKAGAYAFTVQWLERPAVDGGARSVEVRLPPSAPAVMRLQYDTTLFRLASEAVADGGDGAVLYPAEGRIALSWAQRPRARPRPPEEARPPVEPVVVEAHASIVATLDGRRIERVLYRLRFEGERPFAVAIPPGHTVERTFVNGVPRPFKRTADGVSLDVSPARAGEQAATVELVTSEAGNGYPLSGTLAFVLPRPSWGQNDLFVALHLPDVFDYRWSGGSLAAVEQAPDVEYAWSIPTPGRTVALHQQLVSGFADVRIAYTVDLARSYYR
jgi:hypothetical protein